VITLNVVALTTFLVLFAFVTLIGFAASHWRRADLSQITEWGLGGRRFGSVVVWFLLGGDLYTAYTLIAVPALMFGAGAIGFFAVPYTILVYPLMFLVFPRLWTLARAHGCITAADLVHHQFGSKALALAVAITGIVATMPYIALQLVGIEVALTGLGLGGEWPLIIAFVVLAAFTYTSGLRAPALIAVAKDLLIYITVIAAVIVIPLHLGGYGKIFASVSGPKLLLGPAAENNLGAQSAYATLALGSALALLLYPHAMTGVLAASSQHVIRRNAVALPAYSVALGLIALLGYMAVASGVSSMPQFAAGFKAFGANFAVPALFLESFPSWFAGVAFAAIAIGALVPAAVMSIACANLFTRNIYKEYLRRGCSSSEEGQCAKIVSLAVKVGALAFVIGLPSQYAIELQLLGGILIIQTLPSVLMGIYATWLNPLALLLGWAAGTISGIAMWASLGFTMTTYDLELFGITIPCYAALSSLVLNLAVSAGLSLPFNALRRAGPRPAC
jgi:SSS family solute:Na+ symporter